MAQAALTDKCDLCNSGVEVNFFCVDCDEILCLKCKLLHTRSKGTRNHKIKQLSQAREENIVHKSKPVFCGEHSTLDVTLFCLQCDCLICRQCLAGTHRGHNITVPDEIRDSKAKKLNEIIKILQEKNSTYENAFDVHSQAHSRFLKSLDQVEKEVSDQKAKIIEELIIACNEQLSQISKLRQDEQTKYSDACNKIQAQNKAVTSAIQTAEDSIASNNTTLIIQATTDTEDTLEGLEDPTMPQTTIATYQPGNCSRQTIRMVQGKLTIEHPTAIHHPDDRSFPGTPQVLLDRQGAKPKLMEDVHTVKLQGQKTSGGNQPCIDINKVKVKSTIKVKTKGAIHVIVPLKNETAWVKAAGEKQLSMIDREGKIITKSVKLGSEIIDAKEYRDGLLVTCRDQYKVTKLTADGRLISTFSNLSPYQPTGLCVTQDLKIMVCLRSSVDKNENTVARLNSEGEDFVHAIQYDDTGAPLYNDPCGVTSLTTGEVIIVDSSNPRKVVGVDNQGKRTFTWEGEVQGKKLDKYSISRITHDSNNNVFVTDYVNSRVYVLGKNGSEAICLLDRKQGIDHPQPVEVDNEGQLWVGCYDGKIHIIQY